ncbi:MAG: type VI secretion system ATPase TssH [Cellvibrionaceae bacterium]
MEFEKLVKNLSDESRSLFEKAVASAASRSHYYIDIEHFLLQAIEERNQDIDFLLKHFDISSENFSSDLNQSLEKLKTGNDGFPKISPDVVRLLFEAWMVASSQYQSLEVRPIHIFLASIENPALRARLIKISPVIERLSAEDVKEECEQLLRDGLKESQSKQSHVASGATKTPALDQFTMNLTKQARDGKIDAVLGRDNEIRQMIDILCRRKQNNPILTGEAGVGKTAVVEGLAVRIATGDVPDSLKNVELMSLDLGLLQAGAGVKGEFENRLKNVIKEVQSSVNPIIIFIDEAHTLIGAGNQAGAGDAANLLKPALARGELRTIAATTWAEYKKYIETDAALTRRFQVVKVEEPTESQAIVMLRSITPGLEAHHNIIVLDEAVVSAVTLSHRYITGRQLPDKCVSLLDTACARVNLSQSTTPAAIENYTTQLQDIDFEVSRLMNEGKDGRDHQEILVDLEVKKLALESSKSDLLEKWEQEKEILKEIAGIRKEIEIKSQKSQQKEAKKESAADRKKLVSFNKKLQEVRKKLRSCQSDLPLIYECVDAQVIAEVVADWTGIPVGRMQNDEITNVLGLKDSLEKRVVGQSHGLSAIAKSIQTARAGLSDPKRPLGVFMLVGPSGVGKTETVMALAEQLYGSEQSLTVINMSEFKEEHKVSLLMGSPPGYVGYGEGGVLTEAVRRKPYSVVLLDEMEKAHPGVQDIFYQVFDKGILRDGEGRDIDFKNTVIIMTSNTASEQIEQLCADPETKPSPLGLLDSIGDTLRKTYKPAFLGRINIVPYYPLEAEWLSKIAQIQLEIIKERVQKNYKVSLRFTDKLLEFIVAQCVESDTGARQCAAILNNTLLPTLSEELLKALASGKTFEQVLVDLNDSHNFEIKLSNSKIKTAKKKTKKEEKVLQK